MPPNHHIRIFSNGFTALSRLTGREHADIARIILGIIIDLPLKTKSNHSPNRIVKAVRALLDFAYLAQYPAVWDGNTLIFWTMTLCTICFSRYLDVLLHFFFSDLQL